DPGEIDVRAPGGELKRPGRCSSNVEPRSLGDGPRRNHRALEADRASFEDDGFRLRQEGPQSRDEFFRSIVSPVVVDLLAEALEIALDSTRHDVEVDAAVAYLIESGHHLGEEPGRDEPGPDRD